MSGDSYSLVGVALSRTVYNFLCSLGDEQSSDSCKELFCESAEKIVDAIMTAVGYMPGPRLLMSAIQAIYATYKGGYTGVASMAFRFGANFVLSYFSVSNGILKGFLKVIPLYKGKGATEFMCKNMLKRMRWYTTANFFGSKTARALLASFFIDDGVDKAVEAGAKKVQAMVDDLFKSGKNEAESEDWSATDDQLRRQSFVEVRPTE